MVQTIELEMPIFNRHVAARFAKARQRDRKLTTVRTLAFLSSKYCFSPSYLRIDLDVIIP
ncbi:hypothetical protein [Mangrovibacterium lignilyticum]|uniref:hypothetical protein n=1 Tax=Mangrovibacterium lignilyticum TaxID=2668052 RepID=UPI0013D7D87A|nr:hypothetical protein [Mangrovibacterium lignilyticum]